ncbi:MAG TPA: hypothetical protein DCY13_11570 [Verrucomicrobiales bacterium]|nr:hypothetical protein [Verrucomicrobiales bacterium]
MTFEVSASRLLNPISPVARVPAVRTGRQLLLAIRPMMTGPTLGISIVDDDAAVRSTLKLMVERLSNCRVVSVHPTGDDAVSVIPSVQPDIVLLDIRMPGLSGIDCARQLHAVLPRLSIVMVTACLDDSLVAHAFQAGAIGYLVKPFNQSDIARAIENASQGSIHLEGPVSERFTAWLQGSSRATSSLLTEREVEVLGLIRDGLSDKEVGDQLGLTPATVKSHVRNILSKLNVRSRSGAVSSYFRQL